MPFEEAQAHAQDLAELLRPACHRVEVAGSIRRRRSTIGDLEIVAIPRMHDAGQVGLFGGGPSHQVSDLWELLDHLVADFGSALDRHPPYSVTCPACGGHGGTGPAACDRCGTAGVVERAAPWGERQRKALWRGRPVDLFTATPETWGAILLIRTGPPEFSQEWVTGLKRCGYRMAGGRVEHLPRGLERHPPAVSCGTEAEAFALVDWAYVPPEDRDTWARAKTWSGSPGLSGR